MNAFIKTIFFLFLVSTGLIFVALAYYLFKLGKFDKVKDKLKDGVGDLQKKVEESEIFEAIQKDVVPFIESYTNKEEKVTSPEKEKSSSSAQIRQDAILKFLQSNIEATISEITDEFNDVSPRTLRRDMDKLEKSGLVKQFGKTKDSRYKYIG
jgi:predicted HTH transcriptional regulator